MPFARSPDVFALSRSVVINDARMYSAGEDGGIWPVAVRRHGIRDTQNQKNASQIANIQMTDSAKLAPDSSKLVIVTAFRPLLLSDNVVTCAVKDGDTKSYRSAFDNYVRGALASKGTREVCRRIAYNVINGRWAYRNRMIAVDGTALVWQNGNRDDGVLFSGIMDMPLNDFDTAGIDGLETVTDWIVDGFRHGARNQINVELSLETGVTGCEVYPSQNYLSHKPNGFARPLYWVDNAALAAKARQLHAGEDIMILGQAALRDQKVWNGLRTIDTWYDDFDAVGRPIAIEPLGASLETGDFMRKGGKGRGTTVYDYLRRIDEIDPDSTEGMYLTACLIRGGVLADEKATKAGNDKSADGNGDDV